MSRSLFVKVLPYEPDSAQVFNRIAGLPNAVLLDSGRPYGRGGRFDVLAALPRILISSRDGVTTVKTSSNTRVYRGEDPFAVVRRFIEPLDAFEAYPFLTGAIGYIGYDLGRRIEKMPEIARDNDCLPEMLLGIYDWAVIVDHAACKTTLLGFRNAQMADTGFEGICAMLAGGNTGRVVHPFEAVGLPRANMSKEEYLDKFDTVMDYIRAGDCYQVNLAQKFVAPVSGDSWEAYRRLRCLNPAPFSAYLDFGRFQIISISPERFLQLRAGHVTTQPIKGTCPRYKDQAADLQAVESLRNSRKDRAENLMIVDLLRNDLSKNCRFGSVRVSNLFDIVTVANVHHIVSTVEAELAEGKDALDLLRDCFPGGSITGAPKLRAMEIIEELEPDRRGVYCGAIGYVSRHGDMDMSIAIRTAVRQGDALSFYGGGGLVVDSKGRDEYQETLDKVSSMFELVAGPGSQRTAPAAGFLSRDLGC